MMNPEIAMRMSTEMINRALDNITREIDVLLARPTRAGK
jgi:hypothetical protein